jgi:hypothetical protein
MTAPVNMNQLLYQSPQVDKVPVGEQLRLEMFTRDRDVYEQERLRLNTETVQQPVEPDHTRVMDNRARPDKPREAPQRRPRPRSATVRGKTFVLKPHADESVIIDRFV